MTQQLDHSREKLSRSRTERESNAAQRELEELRKLVRDREDEIGKLSADAEASRQQLEATEAEHKRLAADLGGARGRHQLEARRGRVEGSRQAGRARRGHQDAAPAALPPVRHDPRRSAAPPSPRPPTGRATRVTWRCRRSSFTGCAASRSSSSVPRAIGSSTSSRPSRISAVRSGSGLNGCQPPAPGRQPFRLAEFARLLLEPPLAIGSAVVTSSGPGRHEELPDVPARLPERRGLLPGRRNGRSLPRAWRPSPLRRTTTRASARASAAATSFGASSPTAAWAASTRASTSRRDTRVAVKMLHEDVAKDEVALERFKREYEISALAAARAHRQGARLRARRVVAGVDPGDGVPRRRGAPRTS